MKIALRENRGLFCDCHLTGTPIEAVPLGADPARVVFLARLNGHQDRFVMLDDAQTMRPLPYSIESFKLADQAGLLRDSDLAARRMKTLLALYGA